MKAVICKRYGPPEVLELAKVEKPLPKNDEVLIKIKASAVTNSDIFIRSSKVDYKILIPFRLMIGITRPRNPIIGEVFSGEIEKIGSEIKRFKPGDQVYGFTGFSLGAYAEYKCMKEVDSTKGGFALKPNNITFEGATVAAYGGLLAVQFMEKGNIKPGQKVIIYGASGATGTIAVQLAKYLGAEVTGICSSSNIELVKSLGADEVIDYTKQNYINPNTEYDFILDAVGKMKRSNLKESLKNSLNINGKYVSIDDEKLKLDSKRLDYLRDIIESGHIKPVLDKCYTLEEIVEAHRYVEKGHKIGGVAIRIN